MPSVVGKRPMTNIRFIENIVIRQSSAVIRLLRLPIDTIGNSKGIIECIVELVPALRCRQAFSDVLNAHWRAVADRPRPSMRFSPSAYRKTSEPVYMIFSMLLHQSKSCRFPPWQSEFPPKPSRSYIESSCFFLNILIVPKMNLPAYRAMNSHDMQAIGRMG